MLDFTPYSVVLTTHISTFIVNIILVILADCNGFRWVMGWKPVLQQSFMLWLHRILSVGLVISIVTGVYLFYVNLDYFEAVSVPAFYVKVGLVMALVVNSFVIAKHMDIASERPFSTLTKQEKIPLFISGAVSTTSWLGVYVCAQFIGLS